MLGWNKNSVHGHWHSFNLYLDGVSGQQILYIVWISIKECIYDRLIMGLLTVTVYCTWYYTLHLLSPLSSDKHKVSYLPCTRSFLRVQMLKCYQGFQTGWSVLFDLCFLCREPRTQQWILNAIFVYFINVFSAVCHELQMKHFQSVNHRLLQAWPFNYIYEKNWSKQEFSYVHTQFSAMDRTLFSFVQTNMIRK